MNLSNIVLKQVGEYPQIVGANMDNKTVGVLKDLISARGGELNSVLQYIYQSTIADITDADLGELFEEIAIIDMEHIGLLMHAITDFGGKPTYENSNGVPFNANCVRYLDKLKEMLSLNISETETSIDNYHRAIEMVNNESLKQLLGHIVKNKHLRLDALKQIISTVKFLSV